MVAIAGNYLVPETISYNHKVTMKTTMTSIEWFAIQLCEKMYMEGSGKLMGELINQAKEMHKQEMVNFGNDLIAQNDINYIGKPDLAEQYYNETFKTKE